MKIAPRMFSYALRALARKFIRRIRGQPMIREVASQEAALSICMACPKRVGKQCSICLCFIETKVVFADEFCPENPPRWM